MKSTRKLFALILTLLAVAVSPAAAQEWIQLAPTGSPPAARWLLDGVYDPSSNRLIIFGGLAGTNIDDANSFLNDVWVLTNANGEGGVPEWIQLQPTGSPPHPRAAHSVVYDPASNRLIIFGGFFNPTVPQANDVWVLTNANGLGGQPEWIQLFPTGTAPHPRHTHGNVVYDPGSNELIIFGGAFFGCGAGCNLNDTWLLTNANGLGTTPEWIQLEAGDPPAFILAPPGPRPGVRREHQIVYDPSTNRMTIFAGLALSSNETWVLTNANGADGTPAWIELTPPAEPSGLRVASVGGYDPTTNRMVVFGGVDWVFTGAAFQDNWVLKNANGLGGSPEWIQIVPTNSPPPRRAVPAGTFDASSNRLVVFGGCLTSETSGCTGTLLDEVWVLTDANGIVNQPPVANAGAGQTVECASFAGANVTLDGSASSDPDGDPLSFEWKDAGGNVVGTTPGVNLTLPLGTHTFTLTVNDGKGGTASDTVTVTVQDTTPPTLTLAQDVVTVVIPTASATTAPVDLSGVASASDACDPAPVITNNAPAQFPIGITTVTFTATDASGNFTQKQLNVHVVYNFIGFLPPIRNDGSSIFKSGRTVPVKFQLTAADGSFVTNATATLQVFKITDSVLGSVEVDSSGEANADTSFRFDPTTNQYIFNLSTKGYSSGTFLLRVSLNDQTTHEVQVSVR